MYKNIFTFLVLYKIKLQHKNILFFYWMLDVSQTAPYEITLVCLWSIPPSVPDSPRPSVSH